MKMPAKQSVKSFLTSVSPKTLVRFTRPFDNDASTMGYVSACGPAFFLLALVNDGIWFDGFCCYRYKDVRRLRVPANNNHFVESALRKRGEQRPKMPRMSLVSVAEIVSSAGRHAAVVTIHREQVNPDVCHIGRVISADNSHITLLEIGPDAVWETQPTVYNTKEITQINFGGSYEDALVLVGGSNPKIKPSPRS